MGGGVNGGQLYGNWPGLAEEALFQGADVWATTDYRSVFRGSLVAPDFADPEIIFRSGME